MDAKLEQIQVALIVLIFIGFIPMLLFLYMGIYPLSIYSNADEYKKGFFYMEEFDCGSGNGSEDFNCYGYGTINNVKTRVNLGLAPGTTTIYKKNTYADLSSDTISVFFRPDLKQTIVVRNNENEFNKNKYLKTGIINLIYPILIYPLILLLYLKITKRLRKKENSNIYES